MRTLQQVLLSVCLLGLLTVTAASRDDDRIYKHLYYYCAPETAKLPLCQRIVMVPYSDDGKEIVVLKEYLGNVEGIGGCFFPGGIWGGGTLKAAEADEKGKVNAISKSEVPHQEKVSIGYDVTGESKRIVLLPDGSLGTGWRSEYKDTFGSAVYRMAVTGPLKGWYMDFEDPIEVEELTNVRGVRLRCRIYKGILRERPGPRSILWTEKVDKSR